MSGWRKRKGVPSASTGHVSQALSARNCALETARGPIPRTTWTDLAATSSSAPISAPSTLTPSDPQSCAWKPGSPARTTRAGAPDGTAACAGDCRPSPARSLHALLHCDEEDPPDGAKGAARDAGQRGMAGAAGARPRAGGDAWERGRAWGDGPRAEGRDAREKNEEAEGGLWVRNVRRRGDPRATGLEDGGPWAVTGAAGAAESEGTGGSTGIRRRGGTDDAGASAGCSPKRGDRSGGGLGTHPRDSENEARGCAVSEAHRVGVGQGTGPGWPEAGAWWGAGGRWCGGGAADAECACAPPADRVDVPRSGRSARAEAPRAEGGAAGAALGTGDCGVGEAVHSRGACGPGPGLRGCAACALGSRLTSPRSPVGQVLRACGPGHAPGMGQGSTQACDDEGPAPHGDSSSGGGPGEGDGSCRHGPSEGPAAVGWAGTARPHSEVAVGGDHGPAAAWDERGPRTEAAPQTGGADALEICFAHPPGGPGEPGGWRGSPGGREAAAGDVLQRRDAVVCHRSVVPRVAMARCVGGGPSGEGDRQVEHREFGWAAERTGMGVGLRRVGCCGEARV